MSEEDATKSQFQETIAQLNELAQKLQRMAPDYSPPPFSAEEMLRLLRENAARFSPEMRLTLLKELQQNVPTARAKDLLNINTWKGMWFVANQAAQTETRSLYERISGRLSRLPGADRFTNLPGTTLLAELGTMLEGSEPRDFLDVDTWKGLWFIINYSLQNEAAAIKSRIFGTPADEAEEDIEVTD